MMKKANLITVHQLVSLGGLQEFSPIFQPEYGPWNIFWEMQGNKEFNRSSPNHRYMKNYNNNSQIIGKKI
jgi:hypothetical protein